MDMPTLPILTMGQPSNATPARSHSVLGRGPLTDRPDVEAIEVALQCEPGCLFCPLDGGDHVTVDSGVAERLDRQLSMRTNLPRAVIVGTAIDPCRPAAELQQEVARVVRVLHRHGVAVRLTTRGMAGAELLDALTDCRDRVRMTVALATLDRSLFRMLEPGSALPEERLEFIAELIDREVPVDVAIDPLIPHLTDSAGHVRELLENLANTGVQQVTAGYLVLRGDTRERLQRALDELGSAEFVFGAFADGPMLRDGHRVAQFLSKSKRQRGYATVIAIAAEFGMTARIDGLANPDFSAPRRPEAAHHLRSLQQMFRRSSGPVRTADAASA